MILVLFLLFPLLLALWVLRRDHPGLARATIALAAFVKVSPVVLLAYFLVRGGWLVVIGAAVTEAPAGAVFSIILLRQKTPDFSPGDEWRSGSPFSGAEAPP